MELPLFDFYIKFHLQVTQLSLYLHPLRRSTSTMSYKNGLVAQLNSALDYGSRGYWFESSRGH